ncbi:P-loop containing nucleoside triphosphate hydrolase protein [Lentithecium fluviatile CBS 122367]|uniref:P-loop containing nucleoside triphosphate hydrolase protein n=1 Tax=Lentithecium fluviatile CBS 122367 TaxID=1168545 RepID=A0A6G1IGW3_9PLEO|nr:P-loop containing nucleoside triphosphate hydrolase protein [Lentithecium fluviatile CBS 122367]
MPSRLRRFSASTDSSDAEDEITFNITNGSAPKVNGTANGVNGDGAKEETKDKPEDEEPEEHIEPGMKNGLHNLYSGKEDKKGRYQWQDKIPEDIGDPAENDKTAKWALLVRNVKVYGDPTRVLAIHSIVVQSPLLKKLLAGVLKGYPGITVGLNRLEFTGKFEPLIHRWAELQAAIAKLGDETDEERTTKEHANLLQDVLIKEFKSLIDRSQDLMNKRVMTYDDLWTLFQPGATIFTRQDGQETAMTLLDTKYGQDCKGNPCFWVRCKYVDWDGTRFGSSKSNSLIYEYAGTRHIAQLRAFPIDYHPDAQALRARLVERGAKAEALAGPNYRAYRGVGWRLGNFGAKDKYNVEGRIVIDTYGWNRFNPSYAIYNQPFTQKELAQESLDEDGEESEEEYEEESDVDDMPMDGHFADEDDASKRPPLTTEQKLICSPLLRGYSLKSKLWLNFFVNSVKDIEWQKDAFERLVLPKNQKELILGFTESQRQHRDTFDDVIEGKGRGMIILLCGPPGVGKTLTAESVAEEMKVPLFMMSAGDLGLDPSKVEAKLQDILEMCTRWHSVLLLDEADVFLEQRSLHELERNKLVSIFLRVLEYFEGTMFLTTNRVQTFDQAFQSRIHISLDYQELSVNSRRTVWKNFLDSSPQEHCITKKELDELARMSLNGRQIKNILKIARLLATRKDAKLSHDHIITTLEVTQHLHSENQVSEQTRGTLYG